MLGDNAAREVRMPLANIASFRMQQRKIRTDALRWTTLILVKNMCFSTTGNSLMLTQRKSALRSVSCSLLWPRCRAKQPVRSPRDESKVDTVHVPHCAPPPHRGSIGPTISICCRQHHLQSHKWICSQRVVVHGACSLPIAAQS